LTEEEDGNETALSVCTKEEKKAEKNGRARTKRQAKKEPLVYSSLP